MQGREKIKWLGCQQVIYLPYDSLKTQTNSIWHFSSLFLRATLAY